MSNLVDMNEDERKAYDAEKRLGAERVTLSGNAPRTSQDAAAPGPIDGTGMHEDYWILSDAERAKGFVRPVRRSYRHVGLPPPRYPLRSLTAEEHERFDGSGYVKFEKYPDGEGISGRFWTQASLDRVHAGCGTVTTMNTKIAETYARDPKFYGATFCAGCHVHLPVGEYGEFVWDGSDKRVGT